MTLQQLRYLCAIVDHDLNLSNASDTLHRSQPGVSRYVRTLEDELGTRLFVRSGKRLVALTKAGEAILGVARRMLADAGTISQIGREFSAKDEGDLTVATTHTHARYVLPKTIKAFIDRYPKVRLSLRQGNPTEIAEWIAAGEADLSIAAEPLTPVRNLILLPCYQLMRIVLAKPDHEVLQLKKVTLADLAQHPMITYDSLFTGRAKIAEEFRRAGLSPRIVMSATDADVMKTYVKMGIGIAIAASIVYDPTLDASIRMRDVSHLFPPNTIYVGMAKDSYLRSYAYDFIEMFEPSLTRKAVDAAFSAAILSE
ncbi:LysR family transcriptional regulator [Rhizobium sp. P32RR-XVIII]|uniref:LysR substrate-binding domain-containing protein n=1 Tax=Rhizobium sp. P32RR-XVIII TaxID=2726738 RepID=UPI0014577183|nr:LysR substrate-binding domain-containing protein [Rhizobium sp. P32RR-XVIII]NLS06072.1 LysR family transcriptional regulator [Rhizobium sp. P32RR-XVIII]